MRLCFEKFQISPNFVPRGFLQSGPCVCISSFTSTGSISIYFEALFQHHSTSAQTRFYLNLYSVTFVMKHPHIITFQVSFGISMFFTGLALMNVGGTSSTGVRASIHNGFWAWKGAVLSLLCVTTFVIPVPHLDR